MNTKRKIAHIVNIASFPEDSNLHFAQSITIQTMRIAKDFAGTTANIALYSAQYPEDRSFVPESINATRDLDRSTLNIGNFQVKRKLPIIKDILDRVYEKSDVEYIIYSNIDIGLFPNFYVSVDKLIDSGFDSFIINRRTISNSYKQTEEIPLIYAEVGRPHMGYDCFVFKREAYENFTLGLICVGAPYIGKAIMVNQIVNSGKFKVFRDQHLTFHVGNDRKWTTSPLKDYEIHNRREFEKIMAGLNEKHRTLVKKTLSNERWLGMKNKALDFLRLG